MDNCLTKVDLAKEHFEQKSHELNVELYAQATRVDMSLMAKYNAKKEIVVLPMFVKP